MFNKIISLAFIPAALLLASAAHGASTLSLVSSGNSAYQLQGTGVEDAAGLDITLT